MQKTIAPYALPRLRAVSVRIPAGENCRWRQAPSVTRNEHVDVCVLR